MHKIKKEEWLFAQNKYDPEYEEKFNTLFKKYYENAVEQQSRMEEEIDFTFEQYEYEEKDLDFVNKYASSPYWITELYAPPDSSYEEAQLFRVKTFTYLLDNIGILEHFEKLYGPEKGAKNIIRMFICMREIQKDRYEVEVLGKKPRKKRSRIGDTIHKLFFSWFAPVTYLLLFCLIVFTNNAITNDGPLEVILYIGLGIIGYFLYVMFVPYDRL